MTCTIDLAREVRQAGAEMEVGGGQAGSRNEASVPPLCAEQGLVLGRYRGKEHTLLPKN